MLLHFIELKIRKFQVGVEGPPTWLAHNQNLARTLPELQGYT